MTTKTNPTRRKRKGAERARDAVKISEMYRDRIYQEVIAKELGLSQATVSREIARLQKGWDEEKLKNVTEAKQRELVEIDNLQLIYMNAWMRSQQDAVKEVEGFTKKQGAYSSTTTEKQVGNPAFLAGILNCIERRCAILGVEAPKMSENFNIDMNQLTDEQLDLIQKGGDVISVILATTGTGSATAQGKAKTGRRG